MELIRNFTQLNKQNTDLAGGKGASLGEMTQAGIPVPGGFVVLSDSFEYFIEQTHLAAEIETILENVNLEQISSIDQASEDIRALILNAEMPEEIATEVMAHFKELNTKYVAVRSSATAEDSSAAAWAGQLESYLNTTEDEILEKVKHCWSSLFTPRAIFYRFEKGLHGQHISVAVVVQKMVESEISGIAFSVHPVTEDRNQLIIEAGYGLGEAIVSGQITPDSYVVTKDTKEIIETYVSEQDRGLFRVDAGGNEWKDIAKEEGEKQKLTNEQIHELAELIKHIENHYGFPCDIEWAFEGGTFYIVQSRPITTLTQLEPDEPSDGASSDSQSTPQPTAPDQSSPDTDNKENPGTELPEFFNNLEKFASRPMTVQRDETGGLMWANYNGAFVSLSLDNHSRDLYVDKDDMRTCYDTIFHEFMSRDSWEQHLAKYRDITAVFENIRSDIAATQPGDFATIARLFRQWLKAWQSYGTFLLAPFAVEQRLDPYCRDLLKKELGDEASRDFDIISSPSQLHEYQKMQLRLFDLIIAQNGTPSDFSELVHDYGWYNEYSYVEPLFDETHFATEAAKYTVEQAKSEKQKMLAEIERNAEAFDAFMKKSLSPELRLAAEVAHTYTFLRTDRTDHMKKTQASVRQILLSIMAALSQKTGETWTLEMVANCLNQELLDFMEKGTIPNRTDIQKRIDQHYVYYFANNESHILYDDASLAKARAIIDQARQATDRVKGTVAFSGKVSGPVTIVAGRADLPKVKPGDILVARTTMPEYTPAMQIAAAFVTEEGGITSHAAIVARELQKPCIVGTGNATSVLNDGDMVEVDATQGVVTKIQNTQTTSRGRLPVLETEGVYDAANWAEQGRWLQPPLVYTLFSHWHTSQSVKDIAPDLQFHTILSVDGYGFQYKKDRETIYAYLKQLHQQNKLGDLAQTLDAYGKKALAALQTALSQDNATLELNVAAIFEVYKEFTGFWSIEVYMGDLITQLATEVGYVNNEADLFAKVHPHLRETWIEAEAKSMNVLAKQFIEKYGDVDFSPEHIANDAALQAGIAQYQKDFEWSKISKWIGDPIDAAFVHTRLAEEIANERQGNNIESKRIESDEATLDDIVLLSVVTAYWRPQAGMMEMKMAHRMRSLLTKIGDKNGLTYEQVLLLTPTEFVAVVQSESQIIEHKPTILARVQEFFSYVTQDDQEIILTTDDPSYQEIKDALITKVDAGATDILHGIGASPGSVTGVVRVILSAKQFGEFQKGEILVAPETTPSFVPLMRAASAILTGKGGITSHAAIVSRELGKPCVIAIKDVTKILKTGDRVEVDAQAGTVRILKNTTTHAWNSPDLLGFNPNDYIFHGMWKCNILTDYFWSGGYNADSIKKLDIPLPELGTLTLNVGNFVTKAALTPPLHDRLMQAVQAKDLSFFTNLKDTVDATFAEAKLEVEGLAAQPLSGEIIRQGMQAFGRVGFLQCTSYLLGYSFESELVAWAKEHNIPEQSINDYIPEIDTPILQRQKELAELKQLLDVQKILEMSDTDALTAIKAHPELNQKFTAHLEKFGWVEILGFGGDPLTEERLLISLRSFTPTDHNHKQLQDLDADSQLFLEAASNLAYCREVGAEFTSMLSWKLRPVLDKAGAALGLDYNTLCTLLYEEIASFVDNPNPQKMQALLKQRATDQWALFEKEGRMCVIEDPADVKHLAETLLPKAEKVTELRGQTGYGGKVTGHVRVILSSAEFNQMQKGDILVTTMTTPDFVTLMQMAAAIVTDIGGLLSHAAIVSRELKKPCVIGTKFATQLLKTGDRVEVDADTGVIKILDQESDSSSALSQPFEKTYTRDYSVIMEEAWFHGLTDGIESLLGIKPSIAVPVMYYVHDSVIEVWERTDYTKWLMDQLHAKALADEKGMLALLDEYDQQLAYCESIWSAETLPASFNLRDFITTVFDILPKFIAMYYLGIDDRTSAMLKERVLQLRRTDKFFVACDIVLRKAIRNQYPNLTGVETVVTKHELETELPERTDLEARLKHFVVVPTHYYEIKSLTEFASDHPDFTFKQEAAPAQARHIKGQTAYGGLVTGRVRVIKRRDEISSVKDGDIIVSPMTTPDYLPAMMKAAAFVTDEGGVTCHAAIVARELKKPCVIGTKFATELLQDGDLVEVNATEGTVRKVVS